MVRILIVDDERIEREGIRFLLKQMGKDFEIAEAVNGREALKWLDEHEADILMTDIKMPLMDGMELLERMAGKYPDMKAMIFSGYGEFEYARQAMRFGVEEYILKPVDPAEFAKAMEKLLSALEEGRQERDRKATEGLFLKKYVINALLNGADGKALEGRTEGWFSMEELDEYRRLVLVELDGDFFGTSDGDFLERLEKMAGEGSFDYLNLNPRQCLLLFRKERGDWKEFAGRINALIFRQCGSGKKSYIAVSSAMKDGSQIAARYQELELLMENRFYDLKSRVYMAEAEEESEEGAQRDDDTLMKQIRQDIHAGDVLNLREHYERLFHNYGRNVGFSQIYVKFIFASLLKMFYEAIPDKTEKELNEEMDSLYRAADLEGIRGIVDKNLALLEEQLKKDADGMHREVETVKRYIYGHYGEELGIELLAEKIHMAPSYLSALFKKETGQNLSKFIKAYRMEKARQMLDGTREKIGMVAEKAGYPNVSYFCQSFREYYGVSPQRYREKKDGAGRYGTDQAMD